MTPEEARELLKNATPGPWFFDDAVDGRVLKIGPIAPLGYQLDCSTDDAALAAHAPDMAAMIAGMRTEWSRQARITGDPEWHPIRWCRSREEAEQTYWTRRLPSGARVEYRVVPRYIIEPEEIS